MTEQQLKVLVSLTIDDGDYQTEQARAALEAGRKLGIEVKVVYAGNDSITQSQQLLQAIQSPATERPDVIMFEPVGTGLAGAARAAVAAGMGWVVLNRATENLSDLKRDAKLPVFSVSSDHLEVGRIQGRQLNKLLPNGGSVLCVQGPASSAAAQQRTAGMKETMNKSMNVLYMFGHWTEVSAHDAVAGWLRLSTSRSVPVQIVAAQDDYMAMGAKRAYSELNSSEQGNWSALKFMGCDGLPGHGQKLVRSGTLVATVILPTNTNIALEMLVKAAQSGVQPPPLTLTKPVSFPPLEELK